MLIIYLRKVAAQRIRSRCINDLSVNNTVPATPTSKPKKKDIPRPGPLPSSAAPNSTGAKVGTGSEGNAVLLGG